MPSTESMARNDLIVCACQGRNYKARDAIHAALWRGELDGLWGDFLRRLASEKRADELELEFPDGDLDAAAENFRYEHDLITAEETEQWLTARGLSLEDFGDYFARQYCDRQLGEEVTPAKLDYVSADGELRQLFCTDLILSGDLEQFTLQLMWRLAAQMAAKETDPADLATEEQKFFERHQLDSKKLGDWLGALGRDRQWFDELAAMESAYQARCKTVLLPQARQHELGALRLPLTHFEAEVLEVESRDAAQEALFCVREDGMSMEEVGIEARYPYRQIQFVLEDLPADLQQTFLSVSPGDLLEPMARGEGFELCRITKKVEPLADDPTVQQRIEERLLDRHFSDLVAKHVEHRLGPVSSDE